jgi:hypothetical protein
MAMPYRFMEREFHAPIFAPVHDAGDPFAFGAADSWIVVGRTLVFWNLMLEVPWCLEIGDWNFPVVAHLGG